MLGNVKSVLGDYMEVIVLLALLPIIALLWAGFSAAYQGENYKLIAELTQNDTTLTFNESNITLIITDAPLGSESIKAVVYIEGRYDNYINGNQTNASGTMWRATVHIINGTYTTSFGSFSVIRSYDVEVGYISGQSSFAIRVMKENGGDWNVVKFPSMTTMYVYTYDTNRNGLLDAFFLIMVFAVAGTVYAKVTRG